MSVATTKKDGNMAQNDANSGLMKLKQYGSTGLLVAGAVALISFLRSEGGREKLHGVMGGQLSNLEEQLQVALNDNMPMVEEAIDRLVETLQQGIGSVNDEITKYADEAKSRIREYATTPAMLADKSGHQS